MAGRFEAKVEQPTHCEDCGTKLPESIFEKAGWECRCHRYTVGMFDYREYGYRRSDEEKAEWAAMLKEEARRHAEVNAGDYRGPFGWFPNGTPRTLKR